MNRVGNGFLFAAMLSVASCGREPAETPAPLPAPPAIAPATTEPVVRANAIFVVSQTGVPDQPLQFPPAKVVLVFGEETARATLFSNDPPQAVKAGYTGHSFYFDLTLDAASLAELPGKEFTIHKSQSERIDDNMGLYLNGGKQILQPVNVIFRVDGEPENLVVSVAGSFQVIDAGTKDEPIQTVTVRALLSPETVVKKQARRKSE